MVLKAEVVDAFAVLGLTPDVSQAEATKAYKTLALKHHPDRNYGDHTANARFQEVSGAWEICLRHYEHPAFSHEFDPTAGRTGGGGGVFVFDLSDLREMTREERLEFFQFMFEEMMKERFSYAKGRQYRSQHRGSSSRSIYSQQYFNHNVEQQKREREEYLQRVNDFEREQAAEEARIRRRAREEAKSADRLASAQLQAFQLGRTGKGAEMRKIIEEMDLDVTKPQKLKSAKESKTKGQPQQEKNFETMLHAAAAACDEETIKFLIDRGADLAALNASQLTPFHHAIKSGNTPVVRFLLTLRRSCKTNDPIYAALSEGCHPSKAAKDKERRTPLQLAIRSGSVEVVEMLLKDATVHDVERCWELVEMDEEDEGLREVMQSVLRTKKGFLPPDEKKALEDRKRKEDEERLRLEEEKKAEEKKLRLAQEEEKRRQKKEKAERAAKEAEDKRLQKEAENRRRKEEAEAEVRWRQEAEWARLKAEAEERARREHEAAEEARRKELEMEKKRKQKEAEVAAQKAQQEAVARRAKEEEEAMKRAIRDAQERARREREEAEAQAAAKKAQQEALAQQKEAARRAREEEEATKRAKREAEERARREREEAEALAITRRQEAEAAAQKREEAAEAVRREKLEEDAHAEEVMRLEREKARQEVIMRKRAEQSARDKARNQRLREGKERERLAALASSSAIPKPLPIPRHTRPTVNPSESVYTYSLLTPVSPSMEPEDLHTVAIPYELFERERSTKVAAAPPSPPETTAPSSPSVQSRSASVRGRGYGRGRGRGRGSAGSREAGRDTPSDVDSGVSNHVGNGTPCRYYRRGACVRGSECPFSHVAMSGRGNLKAAIDVARSALEKELADKERELERIRAQLAAANA